MIWMTPSFAMVRSEIWDDLDDTAVRLGERSLSRRDLYVPWRGLCLGDRSFTLQTLSTSLKPFNPFNRTLDPCPSTVLPVTIPDPRL